VEPVLLREVVEGDEVLARDDGGDAPRP
jgi:hypothetical protein